MRMSPCQRHELQQLIGAVKSRQSCLQYDLEACWCVGRSQNYQPRLLPHAAGGSLVTLVDVGVGDDCHSCRSIRQNLQDMKSCRCEASY